MAQRTFVLGCKETSSNFYRGVRVVRPPRATESKGRKIEYFKFKKNVIFSALETLKKH